MQSDDDNSLTRAIWY